MGFVNFLSFDDKQINTEYSALSKVIMEMGVLSFVNEPAEVRKITNRVS
jgi:4-hydroxyphenylpyruvate dioxygenase